SCLAPGGLLVTQNGLPFLQASELRQSVGYFRELFGDAFAYLATTPTYFGGPMSYGWATDNPKLRQHKRRKIARRYEKAGSFPTRPRRPDVHFAPLAVPTYVRERVEAKSKPLEFGQSTDQRAAIGVEGFRHVIRAGDELSRHMACAPGHFGKLGAAAFAAIGVGSIRGADDDYGSTRITLGGKLSRVAADRARLLCVDR